MTGHKIGSGAVETADPTFAIVLTFSTGGTGAAAEAGELEGGFSILNWEGYPTTGGGLKPIGPFRMLEGQEYQEARTLANQTNRALRKLYGDELDGFEIHEIQPVKFGGSPTDINNKMILNRLEHIQYTNFWNAMMKSIK